MNTNARGLLTNARTSLLLDHFFFGRLALYLEFVEEPECKTLAVDGKHIFYNPDFIISLSRDLIKSAIVHEVMHCVFTHMSRRGTREPRKWNLAGDYAINDIIKEAGFLLDKSWLHSPQYVGMSAEHIYDLLPEDPGGDGGKHPQDEVRDAAPSGAGQAEAAIDWQIATSQAAQAAKMHGNVPKGLERIIGDITSPRVPWREVLQRFITQISKDDYTWSRPNKKFLQQGFFMPSLYSETMGEIAVVIDTSGSIDQPTLDAFGSEIKAIVAQTRPCNTIVVYCDADVNHVDEYAPGDDMAFIAHGGGGTDFRPPFVLMAKRDKPPVALVYLTDMYGPFPKQEPEYPVLWCATSDVRGPFGETLRIEV